MKEFSRLVDFFLHRKCERRKVCRPWPLLGYKNRQGNETLMWKYGTGVSYQINNYSSTRGGGLLQLALLNALLSFEMKYTSYFVKFNLKGIVEQEVFHLLFITDCF